MGKINKYLDEKEVTDLAEQAYNEYNRILKKVYGFQALSPENKQAWIMATDRIVELVLHSYELKEIPRSET